MEMALIILFNIDIAKMKIGLYFARPYFLTLAPLLLISIGKMLK
jgi:hypothetical protein